MSLWKIGYMIWLVELDVIEYYIQDGQEPALSIYHSRVMYDHNLICCIENPMNCNHGKDIYQSKMRHIFPETSPWISLHQCLLATSINRIRSMLRVTILTLITEFLPQEYMEIVLRCNGYLSMLHGGGGSNIPPLEIWLQYWEH